MGHKWVWSTFSGWFLGISWDHVWATKQNPVQEGWVLRIGFGIGLLLVDKWHVLTIQEQITRGLVDATI